MKTRTKTGWTTGWGSLFLSLVLAAGAVVAAPGTATAADVPERFVIKGSGNGHGVGMSQYGAYEMSRQGSTANQILDHYFRGASAARVTTEPLIDVQVFGPDPYSYAGYGDTTATSITVRGGGWRLFAGDKPVASGSAGTLRLATSDGRIVVRTPDDKRFVRERMVLQWAGTPHYKRDADPATVSVDGAHGSYRYGRLVLSASKGVPNVVNRLRLNTEYLYGLAEMPASWGASGGQEALRAQAVVARSYAVLKSAKRNATCLCHVVDDVRDQQFSGWKHASGESSRYWRKAVNSTTRSLVGASVLTHGGRTVEAHYYSSSGGRTANSEDVWSSKLPYERSEKDPYSKAAPGNRFASWERGITQAQAQKLFGLKQVASIKVTDRYSSGQARTLTATAPGGKKATVSGKADRIRSVVGRHTVKGSVPSAYFTAIRAG